MLARQFIGRVRDLLLNAPIPGGIAGSAQNFQSVLLCADCPCVVAGSLMGLGDPAVHVGKFESQCGSGADQANPHVLCFCEGLKGLSRTQPFQLHHSKVLVRVGDLDLPVGVAGIDLHELLRKLAVLEERVFRRLRLAAPPGDVADPVDALRMIEDALAVAGCSREQVRGGIGRAAEGGERLFELAALLAHLADQVHGARAAAERVGIQPVGLLARVVAQRLLAHRVEHIEPPHGVEPLAQVPEHELDQVLGLHALALRLDARLHRHDGENGHHRHACERGSGHDRHAARAALGVATDQSIDPQTRHPRDELEHRAAPAVALRAHISGDRLQRLALRQARRRERKSERLGKAFLAFAPGDAAGEGLSCGDIGEHAPLAVELLELDDLPVHPGRARRLG